jgi:hypothetical protein
MSLAFGKHLNKKINWIIIILRHDNQKHRPVLPNSSTELAWRVETDAKPQ